VVVLVNAYLLSIGIRYDKLEQHPMFCFEPAAAPPDSYCALPASPPRSADV